MKRAAVAWLVLSVVGLVVACKRGGGPHTCAKDDAAACVCLNRTFQLEKSQKVVAECGPPPAGAPYHCCHDLDSRGESTSCRCERGLCWKDEKDGTCTCQMRGVVPAGGTLVASCEATGLRCCQDATSGTCRCMEAHGACPNGDDLRVERCDAASLKPSCASAGMRQSKTCDGLTWKATAAK